MVQSRSAAKVLPKETAAQLADRCTDVLERANHPRGEIDGRKTLSEGACLQKCEMAC